MTAGTGRSHVASGLPTNGSVIYARLWTFTGGSWKSVDAIYRAATLTALR